MSEKLIGKWVLCSSWKTYCVVEEVPMLVTKVSKTRVYLSKFAETYIKGVGYRTTSVLEEVGYKNLRNVLYEFENYEDCLACANYCEREWNNWFTEQRKIMEKNCKHIVKSNNGTSLEDFVKE